MPALPDSTIFNDPRTRGFGGWCDPTYNYQITTGAFADFELMYPIPHRIRGNYTETSNATPPTLTTLWKRLPSATREALIQGHIGESRLN